MSEPDETGDLSVIIPAFNEAGRLGHTLDTLVNYLSARRAAAEIVVVDDGSTDDTVGLARGRLAGAGMEHRILTGRPNRGKGYSVREGAVAARHSWTLITDADLSTPVAEVEKLFAAAAETGADIVAGSRGLPASTIGIPQGWLRRNMGRSFNHIVRGLTGLRLKDTQCGFKLWRTAPLRPVLARLTIDGFAWDVELLMTARRAGLTITEVPVEWNNAGGSKVAIVKDSLHMLYDLLRLRLRGP
ncbi:MAG: dolichyl-phosphate beta-glucosyltransferase [Acidobacteriota bacterium]